MASSLSIIIIFLHISSISFSSCYKEKKTNLRFYLHDIITGDSPTALVIAKPPNTNNSQFGFGSLVMMDEPLTITPDINSKLIGRAQGMYALASKEEAGLFMFFNIVFVTGKFNGSMLAIQGRNQVFNDVREMAVVGGSGKFRFAKGYALAKTYDFNLTTGNAIVEYALHVLHQ